MCGITTCPHAWREILSLRVLINDLTNDGEIDLMWGKISPALLLYDVCTLLSIEPVDALGSELVGRIEALQKARLWPTLTEAEDAEMVELANDTRGLINDWKSGLNELDISEMFRRD